MTDGSALSALLVGCGLGCGPQPQPHRRHHSMLGLLLLLAGLVGTLMIFDVELTSRLLTAPRGGCGGASTILALRAPGSTSHRSYVFLDPTNVTAWAAGLANKTARPPSAGDNATTTGPRSHHCSPMLLDPRVIHYHRPHHRFYELLRALHHLPPPVFRGDQTILCDPQERAERGWSYCLPIHGRKDTPYCRAPDRIDLLARPHTRDSMCFASALHMLLVDVYDELVALGHRPALLFGTLLGAIREGATIPFTEDADIGYRNMSQRRMDEVRFQLGRKGYHVYHDGIWRVCIAPDHPLATVLFDGEHHGLNDYTATPYVDLYDMQEEANSSAWRIAEMSDPSYRVPSDEFEPYAQVQMNGMLFDTVADPIAFVQKEYGPEYMVPRPRGR